MLEISLTPTALSELKNCIFAALEKNIYGAMVP